MVLVPATLVLVGCGGPPRPAFRVDEVLVTDRSPEAIVCTIRVVGTSDAEVELPLQDVSYRLVLDGREAYAGMRQAQSTLPRRGIQVLELPAPIELSAEATGRREWTYLVEGSVIYRTPGAVDELIYDWGLHRPTVRFQRTGTLTVDLGVE